MAPSGRPQLIELLAIVYELGARAPQANRALTLLRRLVEVVTEEGRAGRAISASDSRFIAVAILSAMRHEDSTVRRIALRALSRSRVRELNLLPEIERLVSQYAEDSSDDIARHLAIQALEDSGPHAARIKRS